MTHITTILI